MPLSDRDRQLLNDLERRLQLEGPAWVRQFTATDRGSRRRARWNLVLETSIGVLIVLAAFSILLDIPAGLLLFAAAAGVLAHIRYWM